MLSVGKEVNTCYCWLLARGRLLEEFWGMAGPCDQVLCGLTLVKE
jgi:hypothetical protein